MLKVLYQEDFKYPETEVDYHCYYAEYPMLHTHNYWEFTVILQGKIRHHINGEDYILSSNDLVFIRPKDKHCFFYHKPYTTQQLNFMITDSVFKQICSVLGNTLYSDILNYSQPIKCYLNEFQMNNMISTMKNIQKLEAKDLERRIILIKLVFTEAIKIIYNYFISYKPEYPEWLNNFLNEITKPESFSLKIDELYKLTNFSHSHLNKIFKKFTKFTIIECVKKAKLSYAANLLESSDCTVLDVASRIGYDSLSCFHKSFKDMYNITPSEYRKNLNKNTMLK